MTFVPESGVGDVGEGIGGTLVRNVFLKTHTYSQSAPDSRSKGCEFESQQERQDNFLLQSQLYVLTLIWCLFHPHVTTVACKRPWSFCQKCRWQVTPKHAHTFDLTKLERADYVTVQAWCGNLSGNELRELVREQVTVISDC